MMEEYAEESSKLSLFFLNDIFLNIFLVRIESMDVNCFCCMVSLNNEKIDNITIIYYNYSLII